MTKQSMRESETVRLIEGCLAGEEASLSRLYALTQQELLGLLDVEHADDLSVAHVVTIALDDLMCEVLESIIASLPDFSYSEPFGEWLRRIVLEVAEMAVRDAPVELRMRRFLEYWDSLYDPLAAEDQRPEWIELRRKMRRILSPEEEKVTVLRAVFSVQEIAMGLNLSPAAVAAHLAQARRKYRANLGEAR